jgi:excisionase family DNA binding protein
VFCVILDAAIRWSKVKVANKANMPKTAALSTPAHSGRSAKSGRSRKRALAAKNGGDYVRVGSSKIPAGEIVKIASKVQMPLVVGEKAKALMRSLLALVSHEDAISVLREVTEENAEGELAMQLLELQGERAKPTIQVRSGPFISTAEAAKRLNCSAQHVRDLVERNELVGYPALGDRTRTVLPLWQFSGEKTLHDWIADLIKAYGDNGWALVHFVIAPRADLGGDNYLHLLQTNRVDDALWAISRSNPD